MREYLSYVLGNESAKKRLGEAIESDKLSHAFLICGPRGSGKFTLATEIAAAVNCEARFDKHSPLPCHKCNNCKRIYSGSFTDISVLKKRDDRATIGVDDVKNFREQMFLSPTESDKKIYIVKNAELMTAEAQNALLIVLEEPPRDVIIILLSEARDKLLSTINSRTQYVAMSRFDTDFLDSVLANKSQEYRSYKAQKPEDAKRLLVLSNGIIGKAETLLKSKSSFDEDSDYSSVYAIAEAICLLSPFSVLYDRIMSLSTAKRPELTSSLEMLLGALRDLTEAKSANNFIPVFFYSEQEARTLSESLTRARLLSIFDSVTDALSKNLKNGNIGIILTNLASRIKNS